MRPVLLLHRVLQFAAAGVACLVALPTTTAAQVCKGDVVLTSQAEVDAFSCTVITGNLTIRGDDSLTHVDSLSILTSVDGVLNIRDNAALTNIDGLAALTAAGSLILIGNAALANVNGLAALISTGSLEITSNSVLANVDGLAALKTVEGDLWVIGNAALTNVDGFSALASVGGGLEVASNPALAHVDGLSALTSVAYDMSVSDNAQLAHVDGFSALINVGEDLRIHDNIELANLDGFSALSSVGELLEIRDNVALTNIDGLAGLTRVIDLAVFSNAALTRCNCGLYHLLHDGGIGSGIATIRDNAPGCNSQAEILQAGACSTVTSEHDGAVPDHVTLDAVYPNPFNPATTIRYRLGSARPIRLAVYDAQGRVIAVLVEQMMPAGTHEVRFDAAQMPAGVYVVRLHAELTTREERIVRAK